jgi:hypothetical protein
MRPILVTRIIKQGLTPNTVHIVYLILQFLWHNAGIIFLQCLLYEYSSGRISVHVQVVLVRRPFLYN